MTDLSDAVVARLQAAVGQGDVTVYDGRVDDSPPDRYLVVWGDVGDRVAEGIDASSVRSNFTVQVTSVVTGSMTAGECRWLSGQVQDALTDWTPAADGFVTLTPFRHSYSSSQPADDESLAPRFAISAVDQFSTFGSRLN